MAKKRILDLAQKNFLANEDVVLLGQNNKTVAVPLRAISEFVRSYISGGMSISGATIRKGSNIITVSDTTGLVMGMKISGPGIPSGALISEVIDINTFKISVAATENVIDANIITTLDTKLSSYGKGFSGVSDGTVGVKGIVYLDGKPFNGIGDGIVGDKGVVYLDGNVFSGISDGVVGVKDLVYKNGIPYSGVGDGIIGEYGIIYKDGTPFTGNGDGTYSVSGKVYLNGKLFNGVGTSNIGKQGVLYKDGIPFDGTGDGITGILGAIYTNGVTNVITNNGVLFTGIGNGTLGNANILYKDGNPFNGIGNGTVGDNGKIYRNGVLFTGIGDGTIGILGKAYLNGVLFTGIGNDALGVVGKVYKDGVLFTGTGDGTIGTNNAIYLDGSTFNGTGDGIVGQLDKIYYNGLLYSGIGTKNLGKEGYVYKDGLLLTGSTDEKFSHPRGLTVDTSGNLFIVDTQNNAIRKITSDGTVSNFVGVPNLTNMGSIDGLSGVASFAKPYGIIDDNSGNLFVSDSYNHTIRKIVKSTGTTTTFAGSAGSNNFADGTGSSARFNYPDGITIDSSGNLYVCDTFNDSIRKITPAGVVTTFAGTAGTIGSTDGTGSAARFKNPYAITIDSSDNLYVCDTYNNTIRKITPAGVVSTIAGTAGSEGSTDGTGSAARFKYPYGITIDSSGNLYVCDTYNFTIRKITPAGVVSTIAGTAGSNGFTDGTGSAARFKYPYTITIDGGDNLYIGDSGNHTIRRILSGTNIVTTFAGIAGQSGTSNGTAHIDGHPIIADVNDIPFTGLGNGINGGAVGIWYKDGIPFTGTGNGTLGTLNTIYKEGKPLNGISTSTNGTGGAIILNGIPFTGISDGTVGIKGLAYLDGFTFTGVSNGKVGDLNKVYKNGALFTGTGNGTNLGTKDALYKDGVLFTGEEFSLSYDLITVVWYENGFRFSGFGHGTVGLANHLYENGILVNGQKNLLGVEMIFVNGLPYTGFYDDKKLYNNGVLYTGIGTGTIGALGVSYVNGVPVTVTPVKFNSFTGSEYTCAAITVDHDIYEWGWAYAGSTSGEKLTYKASRMMLPVEISNPKDITAFRSIRSISIPVYGSVNVSKAYILSQDGSVYSIFRQRKSNPINLTYDPNNPYSDSTSISSVKITGLPKIISLDQNSELVLALGEDKCVYELYDNLTVNTSAFKVLGLPNIIDIKVSKSSSTTYSALVLGEDKKPIFITKPNATARYKPPYTTIKIPTSIKKMFCGYDTHGFIGDNGNVYFYGTNNYNQIPFTTRGTAQSASAINPIEIISLQNNVKDLVIGDTMSILITNSGKLTAFGTSYSSSVLKNSTLQLPNVSAAYTTGRNYYVIGENGVLSSVGTVHNSYGQLGHYNTTTPIQWQRVYNMPNMYTNKSVNDKIYYTQSFGNGIVSEEIYTQGLLKTPYGVIPDNKGSLYIMDSGNHAVKKYTMSSNLMKTVSSSSSTLNLPTAGVFDSSGNLFIAVQGSRTIVKISTDGTVTKFAGSGVSGNKDGKGIAATFSKPSGITIDSNDVLYVTDAANHNIRKITPDGTTTIFVGGSASGILAGYQDGTGVNALFNSINGITIGSSGNIYVTDTSSNLTGGRIRKITPAGVVTTLAGKGAADSIDGNGTSAYFNGIYGIIDDKDENLYVCDNNNNKIRKITPNGVVTTFVGGGTSVTSGYKDDTGTSALFNQPMGISIDSNGDLYVADTNNNKIRRITTAGVVTTVAGGSLGNSDSTLVYDDMNIQFDNPTHLAMDASRNLYFSTGPTGPNKIKKLSTNYQITNMLSSGDTSKYLADIVTSGNISYMSNINNILTVTLGYYTYQVYGGVYNFLYTSNYNYTGYQFDSANQITYSTYYGSINIINANNVTTVVGGSANGSTIGMLDGVGTNTLFNWIKSPLLYNGDLYVADTYNNRIRKVTPQGVVTTFVGGGTSASDSAGYLNGTGTAALFNTPTSIITYGDNFYVCDSGNNRIRKVTPQGVVTNFAGDGTSNIIDGLASSSSFKSPTNITVDPTNGDIYVADSITDRIRKITQNGTVSTIISKQSIGVVLDSSGNLYFSDVFNHKIRKITPDGVMTTLAGGGTNGKTSGNASGTGKEALFKNPRGLAIDSSNNIYVCDSGNNTIRVINPSGVVTLYAGSFNLFGNTDGNKDTAARFNNPCGIFRTSNGDIYVSDTSNHRIRKITSSTGIVSTIAGNGIGYANGNGTAALFSEPNGIVVDSNGNIFVADSMNYAIRKITPSGAVTTIAGNGITGTTATNDRINIPFGLTIDSNNDLYFTQGHLIQKITTSTGVITDVAGLRNATLQAPTYREGTSAAFSSPLGITVDSNKNLYIIDAGNSKIRKISQIS